MSAPQVWAIVLTFNAEEVTAACLDSLLQQDYPALRILLVDNASPDGSGQRLRERYPQVDFLDTGGNYGYTGGNNRGIARALEQQADYVMVMNNDTILERDCVSRLMETAEAERGRAAPLGTVSPKILYYDLPDHIWYGGGDVSRVRVMGQHRREMERDDPSQPGAVEPVTFATGCCFLMPASVARKFGGFDDRFFIYTEDTELSIRLAAAGYRMLYQPAARMYHREPPGVPDGTPWQVRLRDRNRRLIARTHFGLLERLRFYAFFYPSRLVRLMQYVRQRRWKHVQAIVDGAFRYDFKLPATSPKQTRE
jgi:GT2 family glycosyltransferase